jgi:DNA-binding PadR family transcriptional regulator
MHLMIERTHKTFVTGLPRSIYHAAERLLAAEHIRVAATTRDGVRPERTVYELTEAGERRLRDWVRLLLAEPDANSTLFVPALAFAGLLAPSEVAAALRERRAELARREKAATAVPPDLPRVLVLEAEYEASRLRAETEWVGRILDDLAAGTLDWPTDLAGQADIEALIKED